MVEVMIKDEKFRISQKSFAVDLSTLTAEQEHAHGRWSLHGSVHALWFRRKAGVTRACRGTLMLWAHYLPEPLADISDPLEVLQAPLDGRYGGDCHARWDGTGYWGSESPQTAAYDLLALRPMLERFPKLPDGYHGWWRF